MILFLSILFGLASMIGYGLSNATSKPLSQKYGPAQILFLRGIVITIILAIISLPYYYYFSHIWIVIFTFLFGMAGYIPVLSFTHGIRTSPLGIMAPIAGTSPLIAVTLSFAFLHLHITSIQWLAIVIIVLSNIVVSIDIRNWKESKLFNSASGVPFALIAALGWGIFAFLLVPITNNIGPFIAALVVEAGVTAAAGLHLYFSKQQVSLKEVTSLSVIINGISICTGTIMFTIGVQYFNVEIVQVLSGSASLATTLIGVYFFHEKMHPRDRIATIIMIAGIAILSA